MAKELVRKKKKKWYSILAPKLFNNALIGESFVSDPNLLVGRRLTTNLSNLTGNIRHQSLSIKFEVTGVEENMARTQVLGFEMSPASIRRFVRRDRNRLDDSFVAETSDKRMVRVKPLLLTRYKTKGLVLKNMRTELRKSLVNDIKNTTYENLFKALVAHSLQRDMMTKLRKIYPIRSIEIKRLELKREKIEEEEKEEKEGIKEGKEKKEKPREKLEEKKKEVKEKPKEEIKKETKKRKKNQ